ncbi:MAG: 3-phosphoshikimate 1-carboxyvinyltransferase [Gammaproteobacteria bacterium]
MNQRLKRIDYISSPAGPLLGQFRVPGDKSISHRAIIFGAIAEGITRVKGFLDSEDIIATENVFRQMGVVIDRHEDSMTIHGVGLHGLEPPGQALYFGNSGTSVRLLSGVLAGQGFDTELTGDASLMTRPMRRVVEPLRLMGANIDCSEKGTLPLQIRGTGGLRAISYTTPVASAQLKSCLLLAGLYADGVTRITEPAVTRDHTERMLPGFGVQVTSAENITELHPGPLQGADIRIPGDISSAAFFLVAASICPGSDIILENVGINPTRDAVIAILKLMGADIEIMISNAHSVEPVGDIHVKYRPLTGIRIPSELVPIAIDEFPAILIAAACARGKTELIDAAELRVKESDRIEAMADGLQRLGIKVETRSDGMTVHGGRLEGGEVSSYGDHRIAMAFAISALRATTPVTILDCINVNTSFPDFTGVCNNAGMDIRTAGDNV